MKTRLASPGRGQTSVGGQLEKGQNNMQHRQWHNRLHAITSRWNVPPFQTGSQTVQYPTSYDTLSNYIIWTQVFWVCNKFSIRKPHPWCKIYVQPLKLILGCECHFEFFPSSHLVPVINVLQAKLRSKLHIHNLINMHLIWILEYFRKLKELQR